MGVSDRWVRKLLKRLKTDAEGVVVHGLRGKASNRKIEGKIRSEAIRYLKQPEWHDFGPTFASEQLAKRHNLTISKKRRAFGWWRRESGKRSPASSRRFTAGGRGEAAWASWCSGTLQTTIGWRAVASLSGTW